MYNLFSEDIKKRKSKVRDTGQWLHTQKAFSTPGNSLIEMLLAPPSQKVVGDAFLIRLITNLNFPEGSCSFSGKTSISNQNYPESGALWVRRVGSGKAMGKTLF